GGTHLAATGSRTTTRWLQPGLPYDTARYTEPSNLRPRPCCSLPPPPALPSPPCCNGPSPPSAGPPVDLSSSRTWCRCQPRTRLAPPPSLPFWASSGPA